MQEILRQSSSAESDRNGACDKPQRPVRKLLRSANRGVDEPRVLFSTAGHTDVQIFKKRPRGWTCAVGKENGHRFLADTVPGSEIR
jgi:hypothetical protein